METGSSTLNAINPFCLIVFSYLYAMDTGEITLRRLRYLIAVAETGRFRDAATRCGVSQPSLSVQIRLLEEALGQRLIERSRAGVALTPIGREVLAGARRIDAETRAMRALADAARNDLIGTIRLGAKPTLGPYLLPKVVGALHGAHRDLKLYIREEPPKILERELAEGVHDVILTQTPVSEEEFTVRPLFREPLYLAMAADHPLARQARIERSHLKGETMLTLSPAYHLHGVVDAIRRDCEASFSRDYEGTSLDALRQMVAMGMGVSVMPALYVRSELRRERDVVVRPFAFGAPYRQVALVWRRGAGHAPAYSRLAETIAGVAKGLLTEV